jgi:hypothetical protein
MAARVPWSGRFIVLAICWQAEHSWQHAYKTVLAGYRSGDKPSGLDIHGPTHTIRVRSSRFHELGPDIAICEQ